MTNWLWRWAPVLAQMAGIFFASSRTSVPVLPAGLSNHTGHFIAYAMLGALALRASAGASWSGVTLGAARHAVLLSSAYGATDELHQMFVPNRQAGLDDWAADTAGALVAVLTVMAVVRARRHRDAGGRGV